MPILPLTLSFTAPIAKQAAARIRLVDPANNVFAAKLCRS